MNLRTSEVVLINHIALQLSQDSIEAGPNAVDE